MFCMKIICSFAGSGVFVGLLGIAYFAEIHNITYFIVVQIAVGVFEVSFGCIIVTEHIRSYTTIHFPIIV